ncbi:MAG: alpha/beta hydrolase [Candidatus Eisenbacteria bacterium]|nr:alpha/beta hydrolase [Candidatus Eisenbacteria bacterium]
MRISAVVRMAFGGVLLSAALLCVWPAPTNLLWKVAIGATEYGHLLAGLSFGTALLFGFRARGRDLGFGLCLTAGVLAATPVLRAVPVARRLPNAVATAFPEGVAQGDASGRVAASPLSLRAMLGGREVEKIDSTELCYREIAGERLCLDYYPAQGEHPAPLVVVVHGGSWSGGSNRDFVPFDRALAAEGYAVADLIYRLAPRWRYPAASDDLRAALDYLSAHADSLGIDATRIALLGRSAGAQIAMDVAYRRPDPRVRGVISFYGPTDLHWSWTHPKNPRVIDIHAVLTRFLGGAPEAFGPQFDAASPIRFVSPESPPTLIFHGSRDELVDAYHSEQLAARLGAVGAAHLFVELPWATHGFDYVPHGPGGQISRYAIDRFLAAVLAEPGR